MPSAEGNLTWLPAADRPDLLAPPVAAALDHVPGARVASIDATLADTAAFCAAYDVAPEASANCVVVEGRRGEEVTLAAVMVLATDRADINRVVRTPPRRAQDLVRRPGAGAGADGDGAGRHHAGRAA